MPYNNFHITFYLIISIGIHNSIPHYYQPNLLAGWDTSDLSGYYTIRLTVVEVIKEELKEGI